MASLDLAVRFFTRTNGAVPEILVTNTDGAPEAASSAFPLLRTAYLSPESAATVAGIDLAKAKLESSHPLLFLGMSCADGPPNRAGMIFSFNGRIKRVEADEYVAAMNLDRYAWGGRLNEGKAGFFMTGLPDEAGLWRIVRIEKDFIGRQVFTLKPVRLPSNLPSADFTGVEDVLLREKLERDWEEVQSCLDGHLYSSLITAAKNVAESLVVTAVGAGERTIPLERGLKKLRIRLEEKADEKPPLSFLDYHLLNKLRILHGSTHSDRVMIEGRIVDPEFAITVAQDLAEVLRSAGLTTDSALLQRVRAESPPAR